MSDGTGGAIVLRPGEGRTIDRGNFVMSLKASGEETGGGNATDDRLHDIAQASSMEVVGPVPEGYLKGRGR